MMPRSNKPAAGRRVRPRSQSAREDTIMQSPVIAAAATRQTLSPPPVVEPFEATCFCGRYPARVQQVHDRVEGERALLARALATFEAECATETA